MWAQRSDRQPMLQQIMPGRAVLPGATLTTTRSSSYRCLYWDCTTDGRTVYFRRSRSRRRGSIRRALHPDASILQPRLDASIIQPRFIFTVSTAIHPYATSNIRLFCRSVSAIQLDDGRSFPFSLTFLPSSTISVSTAGSYLRF
ncbi:hypothetical protein V6N13_073958 [Hibiscus sabdariffa]